MNVYGQPSGADCDDTTDLRAAGFELMRCSWDEKTGTNTLTFEREVAGVIETETVGVQQPAGPQHAGWNAKAVLATRSRDEMIYDGLHGSVLRAYS